MLLRGQAGDVAMGRVVGRERGRDLVWGKVGL